MDDNAKFECQVSAVNDTEAIRSGEASLDVLVAPEPPVIINGGELRTTEGTKVDLECVSRGGKPAAEITWVDDDGNSKTSGVESSEKEVEGTKLVTVVSKMALTAAKSDHNTTLTCRAEHGADATTRNDSIRLLVEYAPQVELQQRPGEGELHEGDDVTFNCSAHANPSQISFRWFKDGNIVAGNHGTELTLEAIDRQLHQKSVTCEASNDIGTSESSSTIEMTCK